MVLKNPAERKNKNKYFNVRNVSFLDVTWTSRNITLLLVSRNVQVTVAKVTTIKVKWGEPTKVSELSENQYD